MTLCRYYLLSNSIISTHILTKRMTIQTDSSMPSWINFNSHPHEEDDLVYPVQFHFNNISTHILTKRMTFTRQMLSNTVKFQLTSSRRGWRVITASKMWKQYFNSHPHEEDDGFPQCAFQSDTFISTHILTKRMTVSIPQLYIIYSISTHILTKRMTNGDALIISTIVYFNSHPHEEDDVYRNPFLCNKIYFNSHPHEEDDKTLTGYTKRT